ncbi:hypothetical protein FKP32DRAFT_1684870 [Trametes sanguinea]|nr:hypothetical protein FKP32DRAFT_1684870 [Trametes sanguinea]
MTASTRESEGFYVRLRGPVDELPTILRRALDAVRKGWTLEEDSPPGFYYQADELILHGFDDVQADATESESDVSGDSTSDTAEDTSDTDLTDAPAESEDDASLKCDSDASDDGASLRSDTNDYTGRSEGSQSRVHNLSNIYQVTNAVQAVMKSPIIKQYYHMLLTTTQFIEKGVPDETTFELLVDTGSGTTWVRGLNACKIVEVLQPPPPSKAATKTGANAPQGVIKYKVERQTPISSYSRRSQLCGDDIKFPLPKDEKSSVIISEYDGIVRYGFRPDARTIVLLLPKFERTFVLENFYGWTSTAGKSWREPIKLAYKPGVAICGDERDLYAPVFDGILGLGTLLHDPSFEKLYHDDPLSAATPGLGAPSFLTALANQLKRKPGGESGIVVFFLLRPPLPSLDRRKSLIPVVDRNNLGYWQVFVETMRIWYKIDPVTATPGTLGKKKAALEIPINRLLMLDTGASCSYLYSRAYTALVGAYKRTDKPVFVRPPSGKSKFMPFYYPAANLDDPMTVEVVFRTNDKPVNVFVPAQGFLYNSLGEGLVWNSPHGRSSESSYPSGILGINFFQVVYASFYLPDRGSDLNPYIRLAPQTTAETDQGHYSVPPPEETED